jgi:asparagine N-glycosylation enzyme membrane subunit Stt3
MSKEGAIAVVFISVVLIIVGAVIMAVNELIISNKTVMTAGGAILTVGVIAFFVACGAYVSIKENNTNGIHGEVRYVSNDEIRKFIDEHREHIRLLDDK